MPLGRAMKLPRWIWPLNTVGTVALANLACILVFGLLHLCLLSGAMTYFIVDQGSAWKNALGTVLMHGLLWLSFPCSWVGAVMVPAAPWGAITGVPLNAYLWGAIGRSTWRQRIKLANRRARLPRGTLRTCSNPNCSVHFAEDIIQCPACGSPPTLEAAQPAIDERPPPAYFIALAGVVAPLVCGGVAMACLTFEGLAATAGGVLIGAGFIFFVARWLNRRDDPSRIPPSVDSSDPPPSRLH